MVTTGLTQAGQKYTDIPGSVRHIHFAAQMFNVQCQSINFHNRHRLGMTDDNLSYFNYHSTSHQKIAVQLYTDIM